MTLEELLSECEKRKINIPETYNTFDLIKLLIKDDKKPPDWGRIYSRVLYHTGMCYEEIKHRTIPQIRAILDGAEENISIKLGFPSMIGSPSLSTTGLADEPPKLEQFAAFANVFNSI